MAFRRRVLAPHLDFAFAPASLREVISDLHPQPRLRRTAESLREPKSHFRTDPGPAVHHLRKGLESSLHPLLARFLRIMAENQPFDG